MMVFGAVLLAAIIISVFVLKNRQKRVKVGEFKYYGKDRVKVEREIDGTAAVASGGDAPAPPPEGAPPPTDKPADAPPS
jgi:hypothetical protein